MTRNQHSPTDVASCIKRNTELANLAGAIQKSCSECGTNFYWHSTRCRSDLCCACRAEQRREYLRNRAAGQDRPPISYEPREPFSSMEEINTYLSNRKLECLICGGRYRGLQQHVDRSHGMAADEYKQRFGIPYGFGLVGIETSAAHRAAALSRPAVDVAALTKGTNKRAKREPVPIVTSQRSARGRKMAASPNHISRVATGKSLVPCVDCGTLVEVTEFAAITSSCRILCKECGYKHWKKSKDNWIKNNQEKANAIAARSYAKRGKVKGGKSQKGEKNARSKLTEIDVLNIYRSNEQLTKIATSFGVKTSAVWAIKNGKNWAWLTGHKSNT